MFIVPFPEHKRSSVGAACFQNPGSLYRLKNVALLVWNIMPFQRRNVFLLEALSAMMSLLIKNVFGNTIDM